MEKSLKSPTNQSDSIAAVPTMSTTPGDLETVPGEMTKVRRLSPTKHSAAEVERLKKDIEEVKTCDLARLEELSEDDDYQEYMKSPAGMKMLLAVTEADLRSFAGDEEIPPELIAIVNSPQKQNMASREIVARNDDGLAVNSNQLKTMLESQIAGTIEEKPKSTRPAVSAGPSTSALTELLESPPKGQLNLIPFSLSHAQSQHVVVNQILCSSTPSSLTVSNGSYTLPAITEYQHGTSSKMSPSSALKFDPVQRVHSLPVAAVVPDTADETSSSIEKSVLGTNNPSSEFVRPTVMPNSSGDNFIRSPSTEAAACIAVKSGVETDAAISLKNVIASPSDEIRESPLASPAKTIDRESSSQESCYTTSQSDSQSSMDSSVVVLGGIQVVTLGSTTEGSQSDGQSENGSGEIEVVTLGSTTEGSQSDEQSDNDSPIIKGLGLHSDLEINASPEAKRPQLATHVIKLFDDSSPRKAETILGESMDQVVANKVSDPSGSNVVFTPATADPDHDKRPSSPSLEVNVVNCINSLSPEKSQSLSTLKGTESILKEPLPVVIDTAENKIASRRFPKRKTFSNQLSTYEIPASSNRRSTRLTTVLSSEISTGSQQSVNVEDKISVTDAESSKTENYKTEVITTRADPSVTLDESLKITGTESDSSSDLDEKDSKQIRGKKSDFTKDEKTQNPIRVTRQNSHSKSPEKPVEFKAKDADLVTEEESEPVDSSGTKRRTRKRESRLQHLKDQAHLFFGELDSTQEGEGDEKRRTRARARTPGGTGPTISSVPSETPAMEMEGAEGLTVRGLRKRPHSSTSITDFTTTNTVQSTELVTSGVSAAESSSILGDKMEKDRLVWNLSDLKSILIEAQHSLMSQKYSDIFSTKRGGNPKESAVRKPINLFEIKTKIEIGEIRTMDGLENALTLMFLNFEMCYSYLMAPEEIKRARAYISAATKYIEQIKQDNSTPSLITSMENDTCSPSSGFVTPKTSLKKGTRRRRLGTPVEIESELEIEQKSKEAEDVNEEQDVDNRTVSSGKITRASRDTSESIVDGVKKLRTRPPASQDTGRGRGGRRSRHTSRLSAT